MSTAFISSYVLERWNVSTIHRQSSACIDPQPWYYETIIWEWNKETRSRGAMLWQLDSGSFPESALRAHADYCAQLATTGTLKEETTT